ncbi:TetR family transcriptional regulator [Streptomyces sp. NPDC014734]|uniref:TetR family transcriptional regulator n=1 Tax=Streptomyces sp. NPDC014734 TaxID=3364886 RepID=UPI0036FAE7F1
MTGEAPKPIRHRPGNRTVRVRQAALASAMEVLTEKGIARLSIVEVTARAGANEITVYRRWARRILLARHVGQGSSRTFGSWLGRDGRAIQVDGRGRACSRAKTASKSWRHGRRRDQQMQSPGSAVARSTHP